MFLSDLGGSENLSVTDAELRNSVMEQARNYPGQEQRVVEFYQSNPQALEQLKGPILEDKVVAYLIENITLKEEKTTTKKLIAYYEAEQAGE